MAYASASQGGYGSGPSVIHTDASHPDVVSISDAELLFTGHLERKGPDLVLTGHDGHHHIVPDYFSAEHRADLVAPNGARITGDLVELLAGSPAPGQYAQAQPTAAAADAIGRIEKVVGDVTVMRNGVAVALHVGDAVYKNDVVQTGADSSCGIGFPDGTALNLVANTKMALNDYVYDPNGTSNDALFNLVQGGFAFVAGKVAHTGDMKIGTPVATMGIRGTTGYALQQVATVNANVGNVTMSFAVVADPGTNRVGQYDLIDQFGNVVAQIGQAGVWTNVSFQGANQSPNISYTQMTASNFAIEQALVPALVQILNNINNLSPTPQSGPNNPGSSTPPIFELINLPQTLQQNSGTPFSISLAGNGSSGSTTPATVIISTNEGTGATATVNWTSQSSGTWETAANWSDLTTPAAPEFVSINSPVKVTIAAAESASGLLIIDGAIVNVISGGALELSNGISNYGTFQLNSSGADPTLAINGTVYLLDSGKLQLLGPTASNLIIGVSGTGATLDNVGNTIIGSGTIGRGDGQLTLVNGAAGTIEAKPLGGADSGLLVIDTGNPVSNSGHMMAAAGGTLQIDDSVTNFGTIGANGSDAVIALEAVHISHGTLETQAGGVIETLAGASTFSKVTIADGSFVDAGAHTVLHLQGSTLLDGTVTFEGRGIFNLDAGAALTGKANTSVELDNSSTIDGSGNIGAGNPHFALLNEQSGVIDANGRQALVIDNDSPEQANTQPNNAIINFGTIEATAGGTLTLDSDTVDNNGTLEANGGKLVVASNTDITGNATVTIKDSGTAEFAGGSSLQPLDLNARFSGLGTLQLDYSQFYDGTITGFGTGDALVLTNLAHSANEYAIWNNGVLTIYEGVTPEETIAISGDYAPNNFAVINDDGNTEVVLQPVDQWTQILQGGSWGTAANWSAGVPTSTTNAAIDGSGAYTVTISGDVEARTLAIGDPNATLEGTGTLTTGALYNEGTILAGTGQTLTISDPSGANTGDHPIINQGTLEATGGGVLDIQDNRIDNAGTGTHGIIVDGASSGLVVDTGNLQLAGGGDVTLENGGQITENANYVLANPDAIVTLDNIDNTIEGAGTIGSGDGYFRLANQADGTIDADVSGRTLTIDTGNRLVNDGTLEATNRGILIVDGMVKGTGTETIGDHATLDFQSGVSADQTVTFTGHKATLALSHPAHFDATIAGLADGDAIDLTNIHPRSIASAEIEGSQLVVSFKGDREPLTFNIPADLADDQFVVKADHHGGTDLVFESVDTWTNGNSTYEWSDAGNWSTGSPPAANEHAVIGAGADPIIASSIAFDHIAVHDEGTIGVASGSTLTLDDGTSINGSGNGTLAIGFGDNALDIEAGTNRHGATLHGLNVTDNGAINVDESQSPTVLTLDHGTTIAGGGNGTLTIGTAGVVDMTSSHGDAQAATFDGVAVTDDGAIHIDGGASGAILTLDDDTAISGDGSGTLIITARGELDIETGNDGSGHGAVLDGVHVADRGTIDVDLHASGAVLTLDDTSISAHGTIDNDGSIVAEGTVDIGNHVGGHGTLTIDSGATLQFDKSVGDAITVTFADSTGTLALANPAHFHGEISGISAPGDVIDLGGFAGSQAGDTFDTSADYNADAGTTLLTVTDASRPLDPSESVTLVGNYSTANNVGWLATSDGHGGADVTAISTNFNTGQLNYNGGQPQILNDGSTLELTDGNGNEATSWFTNTTVAINSFTASFDYQATGSPDQYYGGIADGIAFILQNEGPTALGGNGSDLGYAGISPSAAVVFNIFQFNGYTPTLVGTNFAENGQVDNFNPTNPVDLDSGDTLQVVLTYNGGVLTETVTDPTADTTYSVQYTENLQSILGSNTAYVGFSGSDGGDTSTQTISNFVFENGTPAHWVGASGNDWTTANDWTDGNGNVIATANDTNNVFIDESGAYTLTITSADAANSVTITPAGAGADVQDGAGGSLTIGGPLTIDAGSFSLIGGSLTATEIYVGAAGRFIGEGTVSAPFDNDGGTVEAYGNLTLSSAVTGTGSFTIDNSNTLEFGSSVAGGTVTFGGLAGTLKIDAPASFGAEISMAHSDPGEILDLGGFNSEAGDTFQTSMSLNNGVTTLTVTDETQNTSESVKLVGDFTGANWNATVDGSGGADVIDPPAKSSGPSVSAEGDAFIFHPGMAAETAANFNPQIDTIELDNFNNIHSVQQLTSLITTDAQGGAVIELGHNDSITLPSVTATQLQAHLHSLVHLN